MKLATEQVQDRDLRRAVKRGLLLRCPQCGEGGLLHRYLKVNARCASCGQDFSAARADDGPAYFTILVVAHLAGVAIHTIATHSDATPIVMAGTVSVAAVVLSLFLLPRFKGALIGVQWAKRLHGM